MFCNPRRVAAAPTAKLVMSALLAAAVQFGVTPSSQANPGDLYVTDLSSGSVIVYAPDGTSTVYATGLTSPQGIVLDQAKNVFVADAGDGSNGSGQIVKYDHDTKAKSVVLDNLNNPVGLTLDGNDLLVSDNNLGRVIRVPIGFFSNTPTLFQVINNPLGVASHAFPPKGPDSVYKRFIANGASVIQINPDGSTTDIDPYQPRWSSSPPTTVILPGL
jgi:sugar lactone lactonase YvrE